MTTSNSYNRAFNNLITGRASASDMDLLNTNADSGMFAAPSGFEGDFKSAIRKECLFRRLGMVFTHVGEGTIHTVVSTADAEIIEEAEGYPEDSDTFDSLSFGAFKIAALAKLSKIFVNDTNFSVNKYLKNEYARRFGRAEEKCFITGTGEDEPFGILSAAEAGVTTEGDSITYADMLALFRSLDKEYRPGAVWVMNDDTAITVRTLTDESGNLLWNNSNDTILGRPVEISNSMPDADTGAKPIFFGDLSYFWILERQPLSLKVLTEKYVLNGFLGYPAAERLDGKLIRSEAVKVLQMAGATE